MACDLPCDINEAQRLFEDIPAVASLYSREHFRFVENLLEMTAGKTPLDVKAYRVYYAAMLYLQQSPDNWRIKKHHRTELNDYSQAIAMLGEMQRSQDLTYGLTVPGNQSGKKTARVPFGSVALAIDTRPLL